MVEIKSYNGSDFKVLCEHGEWKIGFLKYSGRFSQFKVLERHTETDEAFVLLKGRARLYLCGENDEIHTCKMKKRTVYNVKKSVWHHITVSRGATVLVVENRNTCKDNTERKMV